MKVAELGEFGLIATLARKVSQKREDESEAWKNLILGIGDDTAAWRCDASIQLATVDCLIQDVHFSLDYTSFEEIGWKALAVNLSDIAAMGGQPRYALVSLALPGQTEAKNITDLYQGMLELAKQHGVAIIGGNISRAPLLMLDVTVLGVASGEHLLTRSSARAGELIAVTGYPGTASAGREMLMQNLKFSARTASLLRKAFLKPRPRLEEGQLLVKHGVRTAIDISDGLVADLSHICQQSQVGAVVNVDLIPVAPAVKSSFGSKALEMALSGGEDYELLFTANASVVNKLKEISLSPITVIGETVTDSKGKVSLVNNQGRRVEIPHAGWEHFKTGKNQK